MLSYNTELKLCPEFIFISFQYSSRMILRMMTTIFSRFVTFQTLSPISSVFKGAEKKLISQAT